MVGRMLRGGQRPRVRSLLVRIRARQRARNAIFVAGANGTTLDDLWRMESNPDAASQGVATAAPFVQVLYVGRFSSPDLIAALRRQGVGVVAAFDCQRGALLLQHFCPDAILCATADLDVVRAYADPAIPVIPLEDDTRRRSGAAATPCGGRLPAAAFAERIRQAIATNRQEGWDGPAKSCQTDHRPG